MLKKKLLWHVKGDRWQVTRDRWNVTRDTWHMTHSVGLIFFKNFSSLAFPVWDWHVWKIFELKDQSISQSMSNKGDCRPGVAGAVTPGLLNICSQTIYNYKKGEKL